MADDPEAQLLLQMLREQIAAELGIDPSAVTITGSETQDPSDFCASC